MKAEIQTALLQAVCDSEFDPEIAVGVFVPYGC